MIDPKCRQCRRAAAKLFLKGERCYSQKCAMVKRSYPPGIHGKTRRGRLSEFGQQLVEKQKVKLTYGVREQQFKNYFLRSQREKGDTRRNLMRHLEMRFDNLIFRAGLAKSRSLARQIVSHRHILIDGQTVNIPSFEVKKGQVIALKEKTKKTALFENIEPVLKNYQPPSWLVLDKGKLEIKVVDAPQESELGDLAPISLIVEFYSR